MHSPQIISLFIELFIANLAFGSTLDNDAWSGIYLLFVTNSTCFLSWPGFTTIVARSATSLLSCPPRTNTNPRVHILTLFALRAPLNGVYLTRQLTGGCWQVDGAKLPAPSHPRRDERLLDSEIWLFLCSMRGSWS